MKLFKSLIPALVAVLSVGFTACSDDDDYTAGVQSPGAFFPSNLKSKYVLEETVSSIDIPVQRTDASAPTSYGVTLTDESGLFSVPATVTFAGDALATTLVVSYDPAKLEYDQPYSLTLVLGNSSEYGESKYEFTVTKSMPVVRVKAGPEGLGTYFYNGAYSGADEGLNVYYEYNENTPNHRTYYVEDFGAGFTLMIDMPDASKINSDGTITVFVPAQDAHVKYSDGTPIWVSDLYNYYFTVGETPSDAIANASYYDPTTGLFSLCNCWYLYGTDQWFGNNYEYLQLNGFPDYNVEAEYKGLFTDTKKNHFAIGSVNSGVDVDKVATALVLATSQDAAIDMVINGEVGDIQEVAGGQPVTVQYPVSESGKYYIVAVSYSPSGRAENGVAVPAKITLGDSEWESIGTGVMQDGWILPGYTLTDKDGVEMTPAQLIFPVEMAKSTKRPNVYALLNPYGEEFPITYLGGNAGTGDATIEIGIYGDFVSIMPQDAGFTRTSGIVISIGNYEGFLEEGNPDATYELIQNFILSKGKELTTYSDGLIEVPFCLFGKDGDFGYSWNSDPIALIQFPEGEEAMAKAKAKKIASPKRYSMVKMIENRMFSDKKRAEKVAYRAKVSHK